MGRRSKATVARLNNLMKPAITRLKTFISKTTIQRCLDGSKGWRSLSVNADSGQRRDWTHNARDSSVSWGRLIVAVVGCYSHSLISRIKNLTWRSTSLPEVTSVITIPSITVNSTSLSSTGELRSWYTEPAQRRRTWRRWKRMSRTHSTTCHLSKFNGELLLFEHVMLSLAILSQSVTQIVPPGLSAHMAKVWAVRKQPGPTGNITAIEHCHQSSLKSWKMSTKKSTVQQLNDV